MTAWGDVEYALGNIFTCLSQTPYASILIDRLSQQQFREIIQAISEEALPPAEHDRLNSVLERVRRKTTIRNNIVHGKWGILDGAPARFFRVGIPKSTKEAQSMRDRQIFTAADLDRRAAELVEVCTELDAIFRDVVLPHHIENLRRNRGK
ncbi:hypothetical protein PIB19_05140 [Sphingomonas sp. 7/4-4]|uniref:hypothetical protein n=1 Tax=Sphingomonas sp. 7/4-4 TaxID=3018446 RepID=UPI0022F38C62|nr:hypothetical protein [Sphingomonas sp. 7/4-4]WBY08815.1 hypothetical protein PIB19_05140 [Sphingomonas sp. 7/4-4]